MIGRPITLALVVALVSIVFLPAAYAANRIDLRCDKTRLSVADLLRCEQVLTIEDEDAIGSMVQPSFQGFKLVDTQTSTQQMTQIINFKVSHQRTQTTVYLLQPAGPGVFTVGPASFEERGRLVQSKAFEVTVVDVEAAQNAAAFGDDALSAPLSELESDAPELFVRLIPERQETYIGEQIAATLYIYSQANVGVNRWAPVAQPVFPGFAADRLDLPENAKAQTGVIGRRSYQIEALDRYLLTAQEIGEHQIPPYRAKFLAGAGGFFGGRWVSRNSAPLKLVVKPLPEEGRPPGFDSSRVGEFQLQARVDRRQTEVGQPVELTIELKATKDPSRVTLPRFADIPGVRVFPPSEKTETYQQGTRLMGRRTAEYLIVPSQTGRFTIPPLTFDYFDTRQGRYQTARTEPFAVVVTAAGAAHGGIAESAAAEKQTLEAVEGALKPIRPTASLENRRQRFFGSTVFLALFWGPLAVLLLTRLVDLGRFALPRVFGGRRQALQRRLRRLAGDLDRRAAAPDATFLSDLKIYLYTALEAAYEESFVGLTYDELDRRLADRGVEDARRRELIALLEQCDFARYAPDGMAEAAKDIRVRARRWAGEGRP
ncbi:MAG: protein BatD [Myxococcales bacterium]|nr:MAG: protein BatD [Myxococcales bacterium]